MLATSSNFATTLRSTACCQYEGGRRRRVVPEVRRLDQYHQWRLAGARQYRVLGTIESGTPAPEVGPRSKDDRFVVAVVGLLSARVEEYAV